MEDTMTRALRKELGLTQEELARVLDVTVRTIARWESGESKPQPHHRRRIEALASTKEERTPWTRMRSS